MVGVRGQRGGRQRKLDPSEIRRLRARLGHGEPKAIVAKKFGISVRTLDRYLAR
ncbi:MAG: helix-turn-helix domain-containing protein [Terriglobia bacterium]